METYIRESPYKPYQGSEQLTLLYSEQVQSILKILSPLQI